MSNLSVRGMDPATLSRLKAMAQREGASVNSLLLRLIDQCVGRAPGKPAARRHDDLDDLAGAWSAEDAAAFDEATAAFEAIDPELWK